MTNVTWKQVLHYVGLLMPLVTAVAVGTFALVKYANDSQISAYRLVLERQDRRIQELSERLTEMQVRTYPLAPFNAPKDHSPEADALSVQILSPTKVVQQFADVNFALKGALPTGFRPLLVVRDPFGSWWSWGTTTSLAYYSVQFGVDADRGKQFELRIIVTDEDFPRGQPRSTLPKAIVSSSVVVTRQ